MNSINFLKAHGLEHKHGDLIYKRLHNGNYLMFWQSSNSIDVFLCKWLPASHKELDESCIIDQILSFNNINEEMVAKFKLMFKQ